MINLTIGRRLSLGFGFILALLFAVSWFGVNRMSSLADQTATLYRHPYTVSTTMLMIERDILAIHRGMKDVALARDAASVDRAVAAVDEAERQVISEFEIVQERFLGDAAMHETALQLFVDWKPIRDEVVALMRTRDPELMAAAAEITKGKGAAHVAQLQASILALNDFASSKAIEFAANSESTAKSTIFWMWVIVGGALAIGAALTFLITRSIATPLTQLTKGAQAIARGDLSFKIEIDREDEIGLLATSFGEANKAFTLVMAQAEHLIESVRRGRLGERGSAEGLEGSYEELVTGLNSMIGSFEESAGVVKISADYLEKISAGEIPPKIDKHYEGDFNRIKESLNALIDLMGQLNDETGTLISAAGLGQLDARGNAAAFSGSWKELIGGINKLLDAVVEPVSEARSALERVANRDLTARMEGNYQGDFQKIKEALNTAVSNLDDGFGQVATASDQVASAADQISSGSQALAQGTSEQASTLEEVASSLQELTAMADQSAANAKEAKSLADATRAGTEQGMANMHRLSDAVTLIKTSSDETAKIVKTIDEIAFQTNLLALNAAVEAARAGDAGKGFAVVAEEVRNLAMRSAEAAKSTAQLIEESVVNAENGVALNTEVLENLEAINLQASKVSEVMDEISAAGEQQSTGIEQINTAVEQMNQVTQQTAANAEESSSASEELTSQAEEMRSLVTEYTLSSAASSSRRAVRQPSQRVAPTTNGHATTNGGAAQAPGEMATAAAATTNRIVDIPFDDDDDVLDSF